MAATFLAYWPAQRNGFVWDDTALVERDPLIRSWHLASEAFGEFLFLDATASNFYRPLQRLSYIPDYALWGFDWPGGWHLTSVLIHAFAAVALYAWLRTWLGEKAQFGALGVALLWAVHPLHTSAVTYISGRADPLAALFIFSTLALLEKDLRNRVTWRSALAGVCVLCALLSKESGVIILALWPLRLACLPSSPKGGRQEKWIAYALVLIIAPSIYFGLRNAASKTLPPPSSHTAPVAERPILAARALAEYTTLFLAPNRLHMERDVSTQTMGDPETTAHWARLRNWQTLGGAIIGVGILAWWRWARRRAPGAAFAIVAAAAAWLPVSNLFPLNATMAEHWFYIPSALLLVALYLSAAVCIAEKPLAKKIGVAMAVAWGLVLTAITGWQQGYWLDQRTFIEETVARAGRGTRMLVQLANLAASEQRDDDALELLHEALTREPDLAIIHYGLATLAYRQNEFPLALAELTEAEKSPLFEADALVLRAMIAQQQTGIPRFDLLSQAIGLAPRQWSIARRYALTLAEAGKTAHAARALQQIVAVKPYRGEAWHLYGTMLEQSGRAPHAISAYESAIRCDVRNQRSRERLAALAAEGVAKPPPIAGE